MGKSGQTKSFTDMNLPYDNTINVNAQASKPWNVRNAVNGDGEIDIFAPIGHGLFFMGYTFEQFMYDLSQVDGDVTVNIKSYGGAVHEALGIYDYLQTLTNKVTTKIWGAAASSATLISLAGDERLIAENARYLIHKPMIDLFQANSDDIAKMLDQMQDYDRQIVGLYEEKTNLSASEILNLMREEKFITADKALEMGFVDGIIPKKSKTNSSKQNKKTMSKAIYDVLNVADEKTAIQAITDLQHDLAQVRAEKDEDEEKKKKDMSEKDKEIEDLKAEIAELKKQLKSKDAKNVIDAAVRDQKIKAEAVGTWMQKVENMETADIQALIDTLEAPKVEKQPLSKRINETPPADTSEQARAQVMADFKAGKLTGGQVEAKLKELDKTTVV